ncbi:hypothetical protein MYU51_000683 [Penicillium brevicompactum]
MDPPAHECSLESEDYSPSDAEQEASDQLGRELQANETYKDSSRSEHCSRIAHGVGVRTDARHARPAAETAEAKVDTVCSDKRG